ncbi:hypothetical protein [Hymenobacter sp.]|uniref:hypothetical protein n=1 Tax=Hymenobacter sp. TaxID=1898978 RepID=UPI00286AEE73|nr:hypothetical protein [Hymenobacter sp.]
MKKILHGLLLVTVLSAFTPGPATPATPLYVMALAGAELHEQPAFASKIVRRLPIGAVVHARQTLASREVQRIGAGLTLPGNWIKVTTPAYTGYVFSADLTARRPAVKKSRSGRTYIDLLGAQKSQRTEQRLVAAGPQNRPGEYATTDVMEYANGTYTTTAFDGCFDHEYAFRQLALSEVYHHMVSHYAGYDGKKLMLPQLVSRKGNVYTFTCGLDGGDATQELRLTVHKNGTLVISSYDCT